VFMIFLKSRSFFTTVISALLIAIPPVPVGTDEDFGDVVFDLDG